LRVIPSFLFDPSQNQLKLDDQMAWDSQEFHKISTAMSKIKDRFKFLLKIFSRENLSEVKAKNQMYHAIADSELRYRRLFESAKDGILILDPITAKIIDANPFIVKIIDYPLEKILGKELWEIGLFKNKEDSKKAFDQLRTNHYIRFEDMPLLKKNGQTVEVEFVSNLYQVNHEDVIQCNIRDITERKKTELILRKNEQHLSEQNIEFSNLNKQYITLNQQLTESLHHIQKLNEALLISKEKAEESDKLKSAFLANISHEIRTPMNAILGFSNFLSNPQFTKERTEQFIKIINESCLQLLSVITNIVDSSILETGQISLNITSVNIHLLLKDIYNNFEHTAFLKKITLVYDAKPELFHLEVETDAGKVKKVLHHLLSNAIKFTHQGMINFGFEVNEKFLVFHIQDTGIGIAIENQFIIFERFRQVGKTSTIFYEGNGLGLSISKALVEKLGGDITVHSQPGNGSTFIFTIPYLRESSKTKETRSSQKVTQNESTNDKSMNYTNNLSNYIVL
jgi:PAS domain S-box-containing protein